jgi:hypothetical protein
MTYSKTTAMQVCHYKIILSMLFILLLSFQIWLFGNEIHDVLVVFCQDSVIILASSKTINHLKQVS